MAQEGSSRGIQWLWIIVGLIILVIAVGFALRAVEGSFQYYLTTDEYVKSREKLDGRYVKIAGFVKEGSLRQNNTTNEFIVEFSGAELPVIYNGIPPDTFKEGVEVVVEGTSSQDPQFEAKNLMAKCASKYEAGNMPSLESQSQP